MPRHARRSPDEEGGLCWDDRPTVARRQSRSVTADWLRQRDRDRAPAGETRAVPKVGRQAAHQARKDRIVQPGPARAAGGSRWSSSVPDACRITATRAVDQMIVDDSRLLVGWPAPLATRSAIRNRSTRGQQSCPPYECDAALLCGARLLELRPRFLRRVERVVVCENCRAEEEDDE